MNTKKHTVYEQPLHLSYQDPLLQKKMSDMILYNLPVASADIVVVCIGTDRSTGDALGPLTGSFLKENHLKHLKVYGTLHKPVHAKNIHENIKYIHEKHQRPFIIAIDACLGKSSSVGHIISGIGAIKPGAALQKDLPSIGNIYITGVVNIGGFLEYAILQNTRLSIVVDMAKVIANILLRIDRCLTIQQNTKSHHLS